MAPAKVETSANASKENSASAKVLSELLSKLSVSKAEDEINSVSQELATFINGDIETGDAPDQSVHLISTSDEIKILTRNQILRCPQEAVGQQEGCHCP